MNILIAAVGGQGALLAAKIIGQLAITRGDDVKSSEIHGMSQRGGSVVTTVKFGTEKIHSPMIEKGTADVLLAFEPLEGARYLDYLRPDGIAIVNTQQIAPMPVISGKESYPPNLLAEMKKRPLKLITVDGLILARQAGTSKTVNTVLIGVLARASAFDKSEWLQALADIVPAKFREVNVAAFELGYSHQEP